MNQLVGIVAIIAVTVFFLAYLAIPVLGLYLCMRHEMRKEENKGLR